MIFILKVSDDTSQPSEKGQIRPSLRKTVSLPPEGLRKKIETVVKPTTPEETIASLESRLEDMKKTKEVLEEERVSLLDTICKQDQQVCNCIIRVLSYVSTFLQLFLPR